MISTRYRKLLAQVAGLLLLGYAICHIAFAKTWVYTPQVHGSITPASVQSLPASTASSEGNLKTEDGDFNANDASSKKKVGSVKFGTDPVYGKNLLIETYQRANATIMTLCREQDLNDILGTIRNLEDRFNKNYHYDWVFLNEVDYSENFKKQVSKFVSGEARFGVIPKEHWSYPDFINQEKARESREKMEEEGIIYGGLESYRHMCRFNSGFFFQHPLMKEYKYYWRVEPHVEFTCDVDYDPFKFMAENDKKYGFTITIHEFVKTIETLWDTTKEFINENKQYLHANNLMKFISNDNGESYN